TGWHDTLIVGRDTKIPRCAPNKAGLLRIGAKRSLTRGRRSGEMGAARDDGTRRNPVLDPLDEGTGQIELIRRRPTTAVAHIRDRVKPGERCGALEASV